MAETDVWYPVVADALALHEGMMRGLGEAPAPLMAGGREKLDSALVRARWSAHYADADLADQAAVLALGIAQAHALVDNNKRLPYIVAVSFLRMNGHPLPAAEAFAFAKHIEAGIERSERVADLGEWLRGVVDPPLSS